VGVRQDVVDIDSRKAIGRQVLIDEPRRDGQLLRRLEEERDSGAGTITVVDRLLYAPSRLDGVYETGDVVIIKVDAHRSRIAKGHVERAACHSALVAVGRTLDGRISKRLELAELRLAGDVAHRASLRARTEQRALRTAQHLESLDIEQLEVGSKEGN